MVPDRQKVRTDGRTDGMDGRMDDAKTISLRLSRGIMIFHKNYHALFVIFEKAAKFGIAVCCKL